MENYQPIPLEQYLQRKHIAELPQFVKDEIAHVRGTYDYVSNEMFRELHTTLRLVKRLIKLKTPRSLWTDGTDVVFFNSWENRFDIVGKFYTDEFLEERAQKEEEAKRIVAENRAKKKAEKALAQQAQKALEQKPKKTAIVEAPVVKPKRKRIGQ